MTVNPPGVRCLHQTRGGTVSDFADRWQIGVQNLAKDGQAIASRLTSSVEAYRKTEQAIAQHFTGILRGSGPDPAGS